MIDTLLFSILSPNPPRNQKLYMVHSLLIILLGIGYYTLERGLTEDKWALGLNNPDERILIGIYRIKPSKQKFYELIFGAAKLFLDGDVNAVLTMPEGYQKLNNMPDDPEGSVNYGMKTSSCGSFIQAFPIGMNRAMDFKVPSQQ